MIGTKHITEVVDSSNGVVEERSVGLGRRVAMQGGWRCPLEVSETRMLA